MKEDLYWFDWSEIVTDYLNDIFADPEITEILLEYEDVATNVQVGEESISQRAFLGTLKKINYVSGYTFEFRFGKKLDFG
ncbi:hypothetical protein [Candidatus Enterococcus leclercqii]|uniref:hypothetical protein n=1 Tax=Candidatus Enterococcus leclercqii TaxID=1857218 RepID=UPI00137A9190|nr:hypothetical protein [Enterococcus sp. CU9D]KAF1294177.1 hypothetical protein BAU14_07250 [Enterococcus sp. CU9D]